MSNVSHASLTGSQLHEPKGADAAALGTVYVSNGAGSGTWNSVGTSAFTGMVADFIAPVVPAGWLELDGSTISTSTYSALYGVMALQTSGTRTNGNPTITSIASTAAFKVGYFVFGTGISSGTTIISIDSGTQITLSNNASSSGSAAFAVSPWVLNTGTISLPDVTAVGRFRRSRTSSTSVGQFQADQNQSHAHSILGSPDLGTTAVVSNGAHTHTVSDPGHSHALNNSSRIADVAGTGSGLGGGGAFGTATGIFSNGANVTSISLVSNGAHTHSLSGSPSAGTLTTASQGGTEARPLAMVVLTCVKT